jgi:hypothetical protein
MDRGLSEESYYSVSFAVATSPVEDEEGGIVHSRGDFRGGTFDR